MDQGQSMQLSSVSRKHNTENPGMLIMHTYEHRIREKEGLKARPDYIARF